MGVNCKLLRLGSVPYDDAFELQQSLARRVMAGSDGFVLMLEHPHTYTLGRRALESNVLVTRADLARLGATLHRIDRGGDVTYHGPGQLVGYLIVNLHLLQGGVSGFVHGIESAIVEVLSAFGISATTIQGRTGVWVANEKVAAIGLHVSRGVTTHGFALNVNPDLSYFEHIVPCGLPDAGVTSMARLLGRAPSMDELIDALALALGRHIGISYVEQPLEVRT